MRWLLGALLLISAVSAQHRVRLNFYLTCTYTFPSYSYDLKVFETDTVSRHDLWHEGEKGNAPTGVDTKTITLYANDDGDEWFSAGYQPMVKILHTCTKDQRAVEWIGYQRQLIDIGKRLSQTDAHLNLTERTKETSSNFYDANVSYPNE